MSIPAIKAVGIFQAPGRPSRGSRLARSMPNLRGSAAGRADAARPADQHRRRGGSGRHQRPGSPTEEYNEANLDDDEAATLGGSEDAAVSPAADRAQRGLRRSAAEVAASDGGDCARGMRSFEKFGGERSGRSSRMEGAPPEPRRASSLIGDAGSLASSTGLHG